MNKRVNLFGKTILFTAMLSMGLCMNDVFAQPGGRGGNGPGGGPGRGGGNGGGNFQGGGRSFGGGNHQGGGRNFGGGNQGGARQFGGGGSGRDMSPRDRGSFNRGNSGPSREMAFNSQRERRPQQQLNNRRPQQIVSGRGNNYNSAGRGSIAPRGNHYSNRNLNYNRRPVQVRSHYSSPRVNINIGIGSGYRYNPRFYYGGSYHYRPYYYRPFVAPTFGFRINVLPVGYYSFYWGSVPYYFYDGAYYRNYGSYYEVVEPPLGAKLPNLPAGAEAVLIDGVTYYEYKGTYYLQTYGENGDTLYEVVGTDGVLETDKAIQSELDQLQQNGDVFYQLPEGTKTLGLDGKTYYVSPGGDYYEQHFDRNGNAYYVKVASQSL